MSANRQEGAPPSNRIPKRLIVLCDGTGQDSLTPDAKAKPTNITRLSRAIARYANVGDKTIEQVVYYQPGVGTETGQLARGGAYGLGVSANVRAAYAFFAHNYESGDQIYLFGFSRGAYTARAIAGLVTGAGLLTKRGMDRFPEVYADCYTNIPKEKPGENKQVVSGWLREDLKASGEIDESARDAVQLVGVFDTVGFHAEGLVGKIVGSTEEPEFNNTRLSPSVKYGYHALALDEERRPFEPTLWQVPNPKDLAPQAKDRNVEMEQVWFSGVHSDIGGGMEKAYLSDITLAWMISRCSGEDKLAFTDIQMNDQWYLFQPTTIGKLDDPVPPSAPWDTRLGANDSSSHTWVGGIVKGIENIGHGPRPAPRTQEHTNETIHRSIRDRNMLGETAGTKWVCNLLTGEVVGGEYVIHGSGKTLKVQVDAEKDEVEDLFHGRIRKLPLSRYVQAGQQGANL
jgi:uncharacterized protein (DUF2235 family)